ncbi:sensor histidine kinase [Cohnella sp. JJ-181]|uniref:sensor histidine kinase n=1 Tax=Cohnella rhizoplanae TaxID=2974897 RepID=UPI0022FF69B8|nr:histidine kinase [Cohnella sp. JJ-181]CAI6085193.1 hypothetical protein COHCIP112018_04587 [Cohnella sp. JJ-181]
MELWLLGSKSALLLFIGYMLYATPHDASFRPAYMLVLLIYLCLSFGIPPMRRFKKASLALYALSAALAVYGALELHPLFLLLAVPSLYELAAGLGAVSWQTAAVLIAAAWLLPAEDRPLYALTAAMCFMLYISTNRLHARLALREEERDKLQEDARRLTRALADNEEYARQSEYTIKLEERGRLSQQIHDEVGHSMAGALIQMEAARRLLDADRTKAEELLGNAIVISKEGLERIRLTLKQTKPPAEQLGIGRLQLFVDELSAKYDIRATLNYAGDLDAITQLQWRIIQANVTEAVTNSLKYSGAESIAVEVIVFNKFVKAVVRDDGRGADKVVKGLGIVGMEERSAAEGGTIIVDGSRGFSVTTLLPVRAGS